MGTVESAAVNHNTRSLDCFVASRNADYSSGAFCLPKRERFPPGNIGPLHSWIAAITCRTYVFSGSLGLASANSSLPAVNETLMSTVRFLVLFPSPEGDDYGDEVSTTLLLRDALRALGNHVMGGADWLTSEGAGISGTLHHVASAREKRVCVCALLAQSRLCLFARCPGKQVSVCSLHSQLCTSARPTKICGTMALDKHMHEFGKGYSNC